MYQNEDGSVTIEVLRPWMVEKLKLKNAKFVIFHRAFNLTVALLLYYYWIKDHGEKEPLPLMKKVFWHGVLIVIPVGIVEYFY